MMVPRLRHDDNSNAMPAHKALRHNGGDEPTYAFYAVFTYNIRQLLSFEWIG